MSTDPPLGDFGDDAQYYGVTSEAGEGATDAMFAMPDETPANVEIDADADRTATVKFSRRHGERDQELQGS